MTAKPPRPDLAQANVEKLVAQWLAAQNTCDFDACSKIYAERMTGIKRVGTRETKSNHADWLADRQRMFSKLMKIESAGQTVRTSPTSAVVGFEQTWASGNFKNAGPKQLIVVQQATQQSMATEGHATTRFNHCKWP